MNTSNLKVKIFDFLGGGRVAAAALTLAAATLLFTACKQPSAPESAPPPPEHELTFRVLGTPPNGTLKAIVYGNEINSGDKVEEGKWVIFTATPDEGYRVKEWKVDGTVIKTSQTPTPAR